MSFINNGGNYGRQNVINSRTNVLYASGNGFSVICNNQITDEVYEFEIIARGNNGEQLQTYRIPSNTNIDIRVTTPPNNEAKIQSIETSIANVHVSQCEVGSIATGSGDVDMDGHTEKISSGSGYVKVKNCGDIKHISTGSGNINIKSCESIGKAESGSGKINVNKRMVSSKEQKGKRIKK